MKKEVLYESHISTVKWLVYDVPGNVGWILYIVCLVQCFVKRPVFMEVQMIWLSLVVGILPAVAMAVGIIELISERILKLDRVLSQKRLYRGFGALTWGGFGGMLAGLNALFAGLRSGHSLQECKLLVLLAAGGVLCALFAWLIFKTFHPKKQEEKAA